MKRKVSVWCQQAESQFQRVQGDRGDKKEKGKGGERKKEITGFLKELKKKQNEKNLSVILSKEKAGTLKKAAPQSARPRAGPPGAEAEAQAETKPHWAQRSGRRFLL